MRPEQAQLIESNEGVGGAGTWGHGIPMYPQCSVRAVMATLAVDDFHLCGWYSCLGNGDKAGMGLRLSIKNLFTVIN